MNVSSSHTYISKSRFSTLKHMSIFIFNISTQSKYYLTHKEIFKKEAELMNINHNNSGKDDSHRSIIKLLSMNPKSEKL